MWINPNANGVMSFPTYSYENMNCGGNPNLFQNVPHNNKHTEWHFVYYGYDRPERTAYVRVIFPDGAKELTFTNVNHYLAPSLYFTVGADKIPNSDSYNGVISYININLGPGSFKVTPTYTDPTDKFGYVRGLPKNETTPSNETP